MTQSDDTSAVTEEEAVEEENRVLVAEAGARESFDGITGDMQEDINSNFHEVLAMHAKLNESYLGYKYTIYFPSSCEATIQPEMFPGDVQEKYQDEKLKLGKMDTMPTWLKKVGSGIRSSVTSSLIKHCSNTDTRFGYMIKKDRFEEMETSLLAIKGIDDADVEDFQGTTILTKAAEMIEARRAKRNEWEVMRDAPVTYLEYITYFQENYSILREEIIAEYNRLFDPAVVDVIVSLIPSRESFFNPKRIRFDWARTQEIPACVLQGNTTYRQVADRVRAGEELAHELDTIRDREVSSWRQQTLDAVTDVQVGVRRLIAEKVRRLKDRLDKDPLTEEEVERLRDEEGKQRVVDPARVTTASISKLMEHIEELSDELGQFDTRDEFYQAVTSFKEELGLGQDFDDTTTRQNLSNDIENIITLSLDDTSINPRTGEFFSGLI